MDEEYTYKKFDNDLNRGYKIYFTFVNNRYVVYKTNNNCYTQELVDFEESNPQPRKSIITKKRLKELYKYSKNFEYKVI